ncbi:MAG TPA: energy transducer TonB [Pyrinomonadaceae bacterium]|nr:energy transducer TonB [Pyrinomonadaceae bacterium]
MRKRSPSLACALVLLQGLAHVVPAQGCAEPRAVCNEFWAGFNSIFIGRVTEVLPYRRPRGRAARRAGPGELKPELIVRFVVEKSYRREQAERLEVEALGSATQRPFDFKVGQRYLVFAGRTLFAARPSVAPCGRTKLAADAQEDIDYLETVYRLNPAADLLNYHEEPVRQVSILQGRLISLPKPPYPEAAKAARASGMVPVLILLDEAGKVIRVKPLCGHPLLMEAAERAAWQARFSPTMISGKPIKVSTIITYNFVFP